MGTIFGYGLIALVLGVFLLPVIMNIRSNLEERRDRDRTKDKVQDAIDEITADGKVEGPKGPYVPHKRGGPMTDGSTSPPKSSGYYHHPWQ